jgi:hypothetical protein
MATTQMALKQVKFVKVGILFFLAIVLSSPSLTFNLLTNVAQAAGNSYYVSTAGNDSNPGTVASPWKTIQKAANSLTPGDTVYVRGGTYKEFVVLNVSGSQSGGYVTFENYAGELPIIDGTGLTPTTAKQTLFSLSNAKYVRIKGFEMRNLKASSRSLDPAAIRVTNGGGYIELSNNNVHHIENSAANGNAHGIHILGDSATPITNIVVNGNEVHHLITGWSESLTLSGNIDGFTVTNNNVHDNNNIGILLAGFYGACSGTCVDQTRNGVVANNTVYHIDSSKNPAYGSGIHAAGGIYADGGTNIVIERNHVYENDFGIELASENQGKATSLITVKNNLIHHNYGAGLLMGGTSSINGSAKDNIAVNNTLVENDSLNQGYGEIYLQYNTQNNKIQNNIIYTNAQKIVLYKINTSGSGNMIDYNLYFSPGGLDGSTWNWQGKSYSTWSSYIQGSGNDKNSIFADPLFTDKSANDLRLQVNSPGIDKGIGLAYALDSLDYFGSLRVQGLSVDIGANEVTALQVPVTTPTPPPTQDAAPEPVTAAITVDGNASDWSSIAAISTGSSNIQTLKASSNATQLYLLAQGLHLTSKTQIYMNSDNVSQTGFSVPNWTSSGADYLLEAGVLYRYSGSGPDWSWTQTAVLAGTVNYKVSDAVLELAIPLSKLGVNPGSKITLGFLWNDNNLHKLPASGGLASYTLNP